MNPKALAERNNSDNDSAILSSPLQAAGFNYAFERMGGQRITSAFGK